MPPSVENSLCHLTAQPRKKFEKNEGWLPPEYYRIRRTVQMVREGSETGCLPNSRDFMGECGVSLRTVARDLDFLREEERAPLDYDEGRGFANAPIEMELRLSVEDSQLGGLRDRCDPLLPDCPRPPDRRAAHQRVGLSDEASRAAASGRVRPGATREVPRGRDRALSASGPDRLAGSVAARLAWRSSQIRLQA